jgi:hypothetical protein
LPKKGVGINTHIVRSMEKKKYFLTFDTSPAEAGRTGAKTGRSGTKTGRNRAKTGRMVARWRLNLNTGLCF